MLHHIKAFAPDRRNSILFSGYQAGGTRGAAMVAGAESVKIHGAYIPIAAEVADLPMLSAHADAGEIMTWLRGFTTPPRETFVIPMSKERFAEAPRLKDDVLSQPDWQSANDTYFALDTGN